MYSRLLSLPIFILFIPSSNNMPKNLEKYLTPLGVNATEIATIYGSITIARSETDDVRAGVISAYDDTVKPLIIASLATCKSSPLH